MINRIICFIKEQAESSDNMIAEMVYIAYLAVLYFVRGIGGYEGQLLFNIALVIGLLLFGLKVLITDHSIVEYFVIASLIALGFIIYIRTGEKWFLLNITMLLGIKDVDSKRALNVVLFVLSVTFSFCFILCMTGLVEPVRMLHPKTGIGFVLCYGMIYAHPNSLHSMFLLIEALIIYKVGIVKGKKLLLFVTALIVANVYIFLYSFSYTGFLSVNILIFIYVIMCFRSNIGKFGRIIIQLIFPISLAFSMIGPLVIKGRAFDIINKLLSTRYNLSRYFLTEQPKTLFGTTFVIPDYLEHYTMDCSYVYLFMQYGIIAFVVMSIGYLILINYLIKKNEKVELAITLAFCIGGIAEPYLFNSSFKNITLIFMGIMFYDLIGRRPGDRAFSGTFRILDISNIDLKIRKRIATKNEEQITRKITADSVDREYRITNNSRKANSRMCVIPLIVGIICILIYIIDTDNIKGLYISEELNQARSDAQVFYLTQDDVSQLEDEGYEVLDYTSASEPMYEYVGMTGTMEYTRRVVSVMLWSFAVAVAAELIYIQRKNGYRRDKSE
ncbi:hypothetical protein [Butyrivibrio fibrisolvens]|uniref:hypothetical protein n=1 Tax=Butyrivibrio fibrisolvens TaxID=831 RepID=UPI0004262689|nr:hypothetical protein [Butyrivibrio fibrisolvens]